MKKLAKKKYLLGGDPTTTTVKRKDATSLSGAIIQEEGNTGAPVVNPYAFSVEQGVTTLKPNQWKLLSAAQQQVIWRQAFDKAGIKQTGTNQFTGTTTQANMKEFLTGGQVGSLAGAALSFIPGVGGLLNTGANMLGQLYDEQHKEDPTKIAGELKQLTENGYGNYGDGGRLKRKPKDSSIPVTRQYLEKAPTYYDNEINFKTKEEAAEFAKLFPTNVNSRGNPLMYKLVKTPTDYLQMKSRTSQVLKKGDLESIPFNQMSDKDKLKYKEIEKQNLINEGNYKNGGKVPDNLKALDGGHFKKLAHNVYIAKGKSHKSGGIEGDIDNDGQPEIELEGNELYFDSSKYIVNKDISKKYVNKFSKRPDKIAQNTNNMLIDMAMKENEKLLSTKNYKNGGKLPKLAKGGPYDVPYDYVKDAPQSYIMSPLDINLYNKNYPYMYGENGFSEDGALTGSDYDYYAEHGDYSEYSKFKQRRAIDHPIDLTTTNSKTSVSPVEKFMQDPVKNSASIYDPLIDYTNPNAVFAVDNLSFNSLNDVSRANSTGRKFDITHSSDKDNSQNKDGGGGNSEDLLNLDNYKMTPGDMVNIAGQAVAPIYNLARGLFEKSKVETPVLNPYENQIKGLMANRRYNDQTVQNELDYTREAGKTAISENSSSASVRRGNFQNLYSNIGRNKATADLQGQQMNNQYRADEAQTLNSLGAQNVQATNLAKGLNYQNAAAKDAYISTGVSQIGAGASTVAEGMNTVKQNSLLLNLLGNMSNIYTMDENGKITLKKLI